MEKKSYYAVIPAKVRYNKKLALGARLLYGEITALCNFKGFCYASNDYFADLYEVDSRTIRRWISSLQECKFVRVDIKKLTRHIYIMDELSFDPCDEDGNPLPKKEAKVPKERKDVVAKKLQKFFSLLCEKNLQTKPVSDAKGYFAVMRAINQAKLKENQIVELFDEWFKMGSNPENTVSIMKALSNDQISRYKVRHGIK